MGSDDDIGTASSSADVSLPKATVNKFANEIAHSLEVRLTSETRELIANCCTEFVQLLSSEANEICERDNKKTITPEHVLRALSALGLERFTEEVEAEHERAKKEEARQRRRVGSKRERNKAAQGDSEELLRRQEQLFAMARADPMAMLQGVAQPQNDECQQLQQEQTPQLLQQQYQEQLQLQPQQQQQQQLQLQQQLQEQQQLQQQPPPPPE